MPEMKEQWKFVGRRPSPQSWGGEVYLWSCESRRKAFKPYLWAIPVKSLLAKP
jgi:hypothetical protein